jgi:lactate dehydrogenase-like 2-hydroxyacid dehydrogenase
MGSNPATFRQRDVTQAIVGAQRAGLNVARIEIDKQGKIVIYAGAPPPDAAVADIENKECNEWDALLPQGAREGDQ